MVLSQWSLVDTGMRALSWVLLIDVNWIAAQMPPSSGKTGKTLN